MDVIKITLYLYKLPDGSYKESLEQIEDLELSDMKITYLNPGFIDEVSRLRDRAKQSYWRVLDADTQAS